MAQTAPAQYPTPAGRAVPPSPRRDRTTLVVRLGLLVLFLLGVVTVFGESLAAALFPPGDSATTSAPVGERAARDSVP